MKALGLARAECSNFTLEGACIGVRAEDLIDSGQRKYLKSLDRCLLFDPPKRCDYFEECVLPLADKNIEFEEARGDYYASRGMAQPKRKQRLCDCGELLAKGKRTCDKCRRLKRRKDYQPISQT